LQVPTGTVGSIIGRAGSVINALKQNSGANIQMQQKEDMAPGATDRTITLSGQPAQIAEAERLINEIVANMPGGSGNNHLPSSLHTLTPDP
jgi:far upstream element-binding protein